MFADDILPFSEASVEQMGHSEGSFVVRWRGVGSKDKRHKNNDTILQERSARSA